MLQKIKLSNGIEGHLTRVLDYVELKLYHSPCRMLTAILCNLKEELLHGQFIDNYIITIDAITFTTKKELNEINEFLTIVRIATDYMQQRKIEIYLNYNGRDIAKLCEQMSIDRTELIRLHRSSESYVAMLGFLPGFPYIGGLPKELQVERKPQADKRMEAGAVAIANDFTGIYPSQSPGGWHVIGHTEFKVYEKESNTFNLQIGDEIIFKSVGI
jgi:inhibitor of KinA